MCSLLKTINEKTPSGIKKMLAPIIRRRLVNNETFKIQYKEIDDFNKLSEEEQKKVQLEKLKDLLIESYENVEYYRELFDESNIDPYSIKRFEDIKKLPILTKEDIRCNIDKMISSKSISNYLAKTGGTTGTPLKVIMDTDSIYKERAFVYKHWSKLGYDCKNSRLMTFRGVDVKGKVYKDNPIYNEVILSPFYLNQERIKEYVDKINEFKPDYFSGYPSAITTFCKVLKLSGYNIEPKIKGVFFISEEVSDKDKNIVKEVLGCDTLSFYGHTERSVLAEEINGKYYFNRLYGYTEFIPTSIEDEFEIICTGFINRKMPLIRYRTGDIAIKTNDGYLIKGRSQSMCLIGKNGEKVGMGSKVVQEGIFNDLVTYQFVQYKKGEVEINIVPKGEDKLIAEKLNKQITNALGDIIKFKVNIVKQINLTDRGKFKLVLQNIK